MSSPAVAKPKAQQDEEPDDMSMPRGEWLARVMRKHPDILELRERFRPITGLSSFARNKTSAKTEVREILSDAVVNQLILQFLAERFDSSLQVLEKETQIDYVKGKVEKEALQTLLRVGIKDPKNLFGDLPDDPDEDIDAEVEAYRPYVYHNEAEEDLYIWDEAPDSADNIVVSGNTLLSATLNKLVMWLTNSEKHDMEFRKAFFMTHQSFTTSEQLLSKLTQRYNVPADTEHGPMTDQSLVIIVLKFWVDNYAYDFNEKLLLGLNNFIDNTLARDGHADWAKQLRGVIAKMGKNQENTGNSEQGVRRENVEPKVPKNIYSPTLTLDDIDEEEIARQLSVIDWTLYTAIRPTEFLQKAWTRHKHRAPNLVAFIKRFNDLTKWVAIGIINERKASGKGKGSRLLPRLIRIADHLRSQNNFFSLCAIYTGITNTAVYYIKGLTRDLSKQQLEILNDLERLFSCESLFKSYRAAYNAAKPPCIPFIGVHIRDLSLIEDCEHDKVKNMINFSKRLTLWRDITSSLRYQPISYPYHKVHQVAVFLQDFKLEGEDIYQRAAELNTDDPNL